MEALRSYSGEESSPEEGTKEEESDGQSDPEEDKQHVSNELEDSKSPPRIDLEEKSSPKGKADLQQATRGDKERGGRGKESKTSEQRSRRQRSRSRDHSPEEDSSSSRRKTHDNRRYRLHSGRDHNRHRSRSRSKSPVDRRRSGYHKRRSRSRSRSRSPTHRRRRSRSPDYRHRRRRSSSSERRGSRRRHHRSPERTVRSKDKTTTNSRSAHSNKPESVAAAESTEAKSEGLSGSAQSPQQELESNGSQQTVTAVSSTPGAPVGGAVAGTSLGQGTPQVAPTSTPPVGVALGVASAGGLLPYPAYANLTPEQRLQLTFAANRANAPPLPSFMNPTAMNPIKFQQIKEKRKLLWSGKKSQKQSHNQWESVQLGSDDKETAKFRRLMGISPTSATSSSANKEAQQEHSKRMNVLEYQYESSRYQTHIARGVGLGYGSAALTTELPSQKDSGDKLDEKL